MTSHLLQDTLMYAAYSIYARIITFVLSSLLVRESFLFLRAPHASAGTFLTPHTLDKHPHTVQR